MLDNLDKNLVHSFRGYWRDNHYFIINNIEYEIWYNHMIKPEFNRYYFVNIKYIPMLNLWCAFQCLECIHED